tara:strand:+ start:2827 stop:3072 length:246 start_codon:yes stop_codon:yes gene_type:complete
MKVGDLVTYWYQRPRWRKGQSVHVGLVVESGKYTGGCDVKVLWTNEPEPVTECSQHLSLVDDSLVEARQIESRTENVRHNA